MQLIIPLIILITSIFPTYNFIKNKVIVKPTPKIERVKNYTMDEIHNSTLSEKYGKYDYPDGDLIEFNNCKYKVIDNKSGGRMFEPEGNCPPLILTPIPFEKYLSIFAPTPTTSVNSLNYQNSINKDNTNLKNQNLDFSNNNLNDIKININSEYVKCNFPHSGIIILKKEECDRLVDCQINENLWTPLTQEECKKKQEEYINQKLREYKFDVNLPSNTNKEKITEQILQPTIKQENLTDLNTNSNQETNNNMSDQEKLECRDRFYNYYKEQSMKIALEGRARGDSNSGYVVQKDKELLNYVNKMIKLYCGL